LLEFGQGLVADGIFTQSDDIFFLQLSELKALAAGHTRCWSNIIGQRRKAYAREKKRLQIPSILLSDGQAFFPEQGAEASRGAGLLVGTPVSPGVGEGAVRVMLDPSEGTLQPGEVIVCHATDPSWTPLFLLARGIVMEVGGLMTHGSVVAREYGIPAIVGVYQATTRLQTGQYVRIDGASGNIAVLSSPAGQGSPVA
jgi:pyruvate,water dikinase